MDSVLATDKDALLKFCSKYPLRFFKANRPIYYQGEIPRSVFFIKSGVIKCYNITSAGEEKIISFEHDQDLLPVEWLFNRSPVALYYYDSHTDCQLYSLPRDEILDFIKDNPSVAATLLDLFVSKYIAKTIHVHALEQSRARDKLIHMFQFLVLRFGDHTSGTKYKLRLRLTHQDLANLVGVTRETVSGEIGKLSELGIIKSKDLRYVVDSDKALRILGENDFHELSL